MARVFFSGLDRIILGKMKSIQGAINWDSATKIRIGLISGRMICQKMRRFEAPSSRAASSRLRGMLERYPFTSHVLYGICPAA